MKMIRFFPVMLLMVSMTTGVISTADPAQAQSPMPSSDAPAIDQSGLRLKPGDRINLTVARFPNLSGEQVIMDNGTIQLPMAGVLQVAGLSSTEANAVITEALRPYVRYPQVSLSLLSLSPLRISVTGEVLRPGPHTVSLAQVQSVSVTLSDALILAGGITPDADLRNVIIRRTTASGNETTPKAEIRVDLWQTIQQGQLATDVPIYDGDEIHVPLAETNPDNQQLLLASTLAPEQITVQVAGEVNRPGSVEISPTAGISEVVAAAGGLTDSADHDAIVLFRLSETGQLEEQTFEFGEASEPIRNGDLVVVQKSATDDILDAVGQVLPALNPLFWLLR